MYKSKFNLFYEDGAATHTTTASMALLHWMLQDIPSSVPENPEVLVPYIGKPVQGPYDRLFLVNVIAAAERKFGDGPTIRSEFFSTDWYDQFQEDIDHTYLLKAIEDYEDTCFRILLWLENKKAFTLEVCNV